MIRKIFSCQASESPAAVVNAGYLIHSNESETVFEKRQLPSSGDSQATAVSLRPHK
jgi:hypothetical protein